MVPSVDEVEDVEEDLVGDAEEDLEVDEEEDYIMDSDIDHHIMVLLHMVIQDMVHHLMLHRVIQDLYSLDLDVMKTRNWNAVWMEL